MSNQIVSIPPGSSCKTFHNFHLFGNVGFALLDYRADVLSCENHIM